MSYEIQVLAPPLPLDIPTIETFEPELTLEERIVLLGYFESGQLNDLTPDERVIVVESQRLLSPQICIMKLPEREPVDLAQALALRRAELAAKAAHLKVSAR